jgi:membrane protease YdiL (CAAX protease family)
MTHDPAQPSGLDRESAGDLLIPGPAFESPIRVTLTDSQESPPSTPPSQLRTIPGLADTCLFFLLAGFILVVGELSTIAIGRQLPPFRNESFMSLASDARLMIPAQALQYAMLLAAAWALFGALWHRPFWQGIAWNRPAAAGRWIALVGIGLLLGLGSSIAGNYLPMPKEAPILDDMMRSTAGAWMMFVFGTTGAPLIEELGFRGFLLPSMLNFFDRLERFLHVPPGRGRLVAMAISILLTSLPFAFLHSLQVSYAWAPLLLIGVVSVALCIVRLWTNSLAASTLVHAVYNFSLFAGMLYASDGFRHLEKLNS